MGEPGYRILYLPLAKDDLRAAKAYLAQFYPKTKKKTLDELRKKISALPENPQMYEVYHSNPFYGRMVVSNYLVFYHLDDRRKTIEVHRVLRGSWDVRQYLKDNRRI